MSIMPKVEYRPLPENFTQAKIRPTQVIFHTAVDAPGPTDLRRYFARTTVGAESHFWVPNDGKTVQMMDTGVKANANRYADVRAISIETEDDGNPERNPWTRAQIEALIAICEWAHAEHGIPLELTPRWDAPGIGWHSLWGFKDPIAQTGRLNSPWSLYRGKTCPGKTRIAQFRTVILPELKRRQQLRTQTTETVIIVEETEAMQVNTSIRDALNLIWLEHWKKPIDEGGANYWGYRILTGEATLEQVIANVKYEVAKKQATAP